MRARILLACLHCIRKSSAVAKFEHHPNLLQWPAILAHIHVLHTGRRCILDVCVHADTGLSTGLLLCPLIAWHRCSLPPSAPSLLSQII
jgi:hypothetical protein